MSTAENKATYPVTLCRRLIVNDELFFDAERDVTLPFPPFPGLYLYNTEWVPPDCDQTEDYIERVACDLNTGQVFCYLECIDYRPGSGGYDDPCTEKYMRGNYRDWKLVRDDRIAREARSEQPDSHATVHPTED